MDPQETQDPAAAGPAETADNDETPELETTGLQPQPQPQPRDAQTQVQLEMTTIVEPRPAEPDRSDLTMSDILEVIDEDEAFATLEERAAAPPPTEASPSEFEVVLQPDDAYIIQLPDTVLYKIYGYLSIDDVNTCRLVCRLLNEMALSCQAFVRESHFVFDGRHDDVQGSKCQAYFNSHPAGCAMWSELCLRRAYSKQLNWISAQYLKTITTLTIQNCSINWRNVLLILMEFENLVSFTDVLDMYFWDYATFGEGIKEEEEIVNNLHFQELSASHEKLVDTLVNLKHVHIHRCQLANCVLYIKILLLKCNQLESLEVTTDQRVSPRPFTHFYLRLGQLIEANATTLSTLSFPYKTQYQTSEFHVFDEHNPFAGFLNYVTEHNWGAVIQPTNLTKLAIRFPAINIDEALFEEKLLPLLSAWTTSSAETFKSLDLGFVYLEPGKEHALVDSIPALIQSKGFGVWLMDTDGLPFIEHIVQSITHIHIQLSTPLSTELKHILMLDDDDDDLVERPQYAHVKELQFFNKAVNFRNFNLSLVIQHFRNLTHLNLVDFNIRVDRIHSSESPATIEDDDLQKMFLHLSQLKLLQLTGNMTYLTDAGMTGFRPEACKRMLKSGRFEKPPEEDVIGLPLSSLKNLRSLAFRGVGIKITDVTARFAFNNMPGLKKLHMYGSHQITASGKSLMTHMFPTNRNCSLQI